MDQANVISKLFPRLDRFSFAGGSQVPIYLYFMEEVRRNGTIENLYFAPMPLLAGMELSERGDILSALEKTLAENTVLKNVEIRFQDDEDALSLLHWLQAITRGLANNQSIERFGVDNLRSYSFSSLQPTPTVAGRPSTEWMSREWYQKIRTSVTGSQQRMQELQYSTRNFSDTHTTQLLQHVIPSLPELVSFQLTFFHTPSQAEVTNAVVALLTAAPQLERLRVNELKLGMKTIAEALRHNQQLKSFCNDEGGYYARVSEEDVDICSHLLQEHNMTLIECALGDEKPKSRIQYYLDLNRLGRGQARRANNEALVELILNAQSDCVLERRLVEETEVLAAKQSMVFGLLMEAPSLWCSHAAL